MNLALTLEQQQIVDAVAGVAGELFPPARLHSSSAAGAAAERRNLRSLGAAGWFGLGLPESFGGVGFGPAEDAMLLRECGRRLVSPIVLAGRIGAEVAARAGDSALAAAIVAGDQAVSPARCSWDAVLAPHASSVLHTLDADADSLILAWGRHGAALFEPDQLQAGDTARGLDRTVSAACARVTGPPRCWCPAAEADLPHLARLLGAAMAAGIAEAARDDAVSYARVREQFGRPIGTFQAVQHRCANMAVAAEIAWAQCLIAALSLGEVRDDASFQVVAAVMLANEAAIGNARHSIQVHGGMGFSAECDAHLFLKRAHALRGLTSQGEHDLEAMVPLPAQPASAKRLRHAS